MIKSVPQALFSFCKEAFGLDDRFANYQHPDALHRPAIFFSITLIFYVLYLALLQPHYVFGGEMWAEMATNYFLNSNNPSYWQRFFALDAGYIPLLPRLISAIGAAFQVPAGSIPYLYTWSATIITAMMVGTFCLSPFRKLIASDYLRLLTSLTVLIVADFETRTFISFTYFSIFFVATLTALAIIDNQDEVPRWAWFTPLLMVSKPAVLAVLPMMVVAAVFSKFRFRAITLVVIILCGAQIIRLAISHDQGAFAIGTDFTVVDKLISAVKYTVALLGAFFVGRGTALSPREYMLVGGFIVIIISGLFIRRRNKAMALVVVGLSLIFFISLLNSFALSWIWNRKMEQLAPVNVGRHVIGAFVGTVLVVCGLCEAIIGRHFIHAKRHAADAIAALVFLIWLGASGWLFFGATITKEPSLPVLNNSRWQSMASLIDDRAEPVCVPLEPLGWVYERGCVKLNDDLKWRLPLYFEPARFEDPDKWSIDVDIPASLKNRDLLSLALYARTEAQKSPVSARLLITLINGEQILLRGDQLLDTGGASVLFAGRQFIKLNSVSSIRAIFNSPVQFAYSGEGSSRHLAVQWMGR